MIPKFTMRQALADPLLLGHALSGASWLPWRVLLIAAMGEELLDDERAVFTKLTGRPREPLVRVSELTAVVGRRGGKSTAMAALATYLSACCDHRDALAQGETGVCLCCAQDTKVAKLLLDRCEAFLEDSPILGPSCRVRCRELGFWIAGGRALVITARRRIAGLPNGHRL